MGKRHNPPRQHALLKAYAREWTAFEEVVITQEMRDKYPQLKHCYQIFTNSRYEVQLFDVQTQIGGVVQMGISRHGRIEDISWNELQRIKTEIFGPEAVAVEIYPGLAEEWDVKNVHMLWVLPSIWPIPFGLHRPGAWGKNG